MEIKMNTEEAYDLIELCLDYDKDMSECPERYEMVSVEGSGGTR